MLATILLLCATAAPDDSAAALGAVDELLDAWREADVAKADRVLHRDFREMTMHEQEGGGWSVTPVARQRLLDAMANVKPGAWDDHLIDPTVHVDGTIAVVWSRYRFRTPYTESGVFHDEAHCGIATFQLYFDDGRWQIVHFADTHAACADD